MSDLSDAFLAKAAESLAGANSEFANGRYNNSANRAYYAGFQAAIAALDLAAVHPKPGSGAWDHGFVQAQFGGVLIGRRKLYPGELRDVLSRVQQLRNQADYERADVSHTQAARSLARAQALVDAVATRAKRGTGR
jgi:uncharacterized protein (UPF0332 family)